MKITNLRKATQVSKLYQIKATSSQGTFYYDSGKKYSEENARLIIEKCRRLLPLWIFNMVECPPTVLQVGSCFMWGRWSCFVEQVTTSLDTRTDEPHYVFNWIDDQGNRHQGVAPCHFIDQLTGHP